MHLVYLCAYILPPGSSVWSVVREAGFDHLWEQSTDNAKDGSTFLRDPRLMFFGGCEEAVTEKGLRLLVRFPMEAFRTETGGGCVAEGPGYVCDDARELCGAEGLSGSNVA